VPAIHTNRRDLAPSLAIIKDYASFGQKVG
jgi:hypothetical protein